MRKRRKTSRVEALTKKVDEMFDFFQANQARAAAVLNEFGGVEGELNAHGGSLGIVLIDPGQPNIIGQLVLGSAGPPGHSAASGGGGCG